MSVGANDLTVSGLKLDSVNADGGGDGDGAANSAAARVENSTLMLAEEKSPVAHPAPLNGHHERESDVEADSTPSSPSHQDLSSASPTLECSTPAQQEPDPTSPLPNTVVSPTTLDVSDPNSHDSRLNANLSATATTITTNTNDSSFMKTPPEWQEEMERQDAAESESKELVQLTAKPLCLDDSLASSSGAVGPPNEGAEDDGDVQKECREAAVSSTVTTTTCATTCTSAQSADGGGGGTGEGGGTAHGPSETKDSPPPKKMCPAPHDSRSSSSPQPPSSPETASSTSSNSSPVLYSVKWITFRGESRPVVMQSENGPCPLLSVANALLLEKKIELPGGRDKISADELKSMIGDFVYSNHDDSSADCETQRIFAECIEVLSDNKDRLVDGLYVNICLTDELAFENTKTTSFFKAVDVRLFHGMLVDPEAQGLASAVRDAYYDKLTVEACEDEESEDEEKRRRARLVLEFVKENQSQLTVYGLSRVRERVNVGEVAVFFRNNHFSTMYKHVNTLYDLQTDHGFLDKPHVVWQELRDINGDCRFVDSDFKPSDISSASASASASSVGTKGQQIDQDHLLALSLADEGNIGSFSADTPNSNEMLSQLTDEMYAKQLQEEEDRRAAEEEEEAMRRQDDREQQQQQMLQQQEASWQGRNQTGSSAAPAASASASASANPVPGPSSPSGGREEASQRERKRSCTII